MQTKIIKQGFTLIEILVVLVILSLIATFIVVNMDTDFARKRQVQGVANELIMKINLARQMAVLQAQVYGMYVEPNGYEFVRFDAAQQQWLAVTGDKLLEFTQIPNNISLQVTRLDLPRDNLGLSQDNAASPAIIFSSTGDQNEYEIVIKAYKLPGQTVLVGLANGDIEINN